MLGSSAEYTRYHAEQELCEYSTDELIERYLTGQFLTHRQRLDAVQAIEGRQNVRMSREVDAWRTVKRR